MAALAFALALVWRDDGVAQVQFGCWSWLFELALHLDLALQLLGVFQLLGGHKRNNSARGSGAGGTTTSMRIGLVVFRRIEMDNTIDSVNVDAASRDVGGDQRLSLAVDKGLERVVSLVLGAPPVNHAGLDAITL